MELEAAHKIESKERVASTRRNELWLLNVVRGLSAILIVLYHYTTRYNELFGHLETYPFNVPWGRYAIYTFFMLSGFLTIYTYREDLKPFTYAKKRFFRLYPIFWVCILVTTLYMAILLPEYLRSPRDIILNFTMIPSVFDAASVDGVYWTLMRELTFYAIFFILILTKTVKWLDKIKWIWLGIGCLAAFYCYGPYDLLSPGTVSVIFMPDIIQSFLAGFAIYYLIFGKHTKLNYIENSFFLVACSVYTYFVGSWGAALFMAIMTILIIIAALPGLNERHLKSNGGVKNRYGLSRSCSSQTFLIPFI